MPEAVVDRAKRAAGAAHTLALVALIVITATLAVNYGVATYRTLSGMADSASFLDRVRALAPVWLTVLPAILFMSALARLRRALSEFEAGRFFSARSSKAVRIAGEEAVWALAAQIVIVPTLLVWVRREGPFDFQFELVDLALAAFLVFVAAVGRILEIAAAVQAENDAIV